MPGGGRRDLARRAEHELGAARDRARLPRRDRKAPCIRNDGSAAGGRPSASGVSGYRCWIQATGQGAWDVSLLRVVGLELRFGELTAFENVSFEVDEGELLAVIGPNGAGKTSLFNVLSRVYPPTAGDVRLREQNLLSLRTRQLAA